MINFLDMVVGWLVSQPYSTFSYFLVHSQYTILYSTMVSVMGYLEKQISIQMPSIQNMQIIIQFSLLLGYPKNLSCTWLMITNGIL